MEEKSGFVKWLETTGKEDDVGIETTKKTPIDENFFENEFDEYGYRDLISEAEGFREASSMGGSVEGL